MNFEYNLIPYNEEKRAKADEVIGKTLYRDPSVFINMYNAGVLNKQFDETKNLVELIKNTYSNVTITGATISIRSAEELMTENLSTLFDSWRALSKLRREINDSINANKIDRNTVLYVDNLGYVKAVDTENKKLNNLGFSKMLEKGVQQLLRNSSVNNGVGKEHPDYNDEYNEYDNGEHLGSYDDNNEFVLDLNSAHEDTSVVSEVVEDSNKKNNKNKNKKDKKVDTDFEEYAEIQDRTFIPEDVLNLDDSFIHDVYEIIPEEVLNN